MTTARCQHQRRHEVRRFGIDKGVMLQQQSHDFNMTMGSGIVQSRPAGIVHFNIACQQDFNHFLIGAESGQHQWAFTCPVALIEVDARVPDQMFEDFH